MPKHTLTLLLIIVGLMFIGGGVLMAQNETATPAFTEPTPTVRPVDLACDLDTLLTQRQALSETLTTFEQDADSNPGLALDNLFKAGAAYQELALECGYIPADAATRTVGTDVERILTTLQELSGDPINGQLLYNGEFGCAGCHEGDTRVGPATEGTYTRIDEIRLNDPTLTDYTMEQFIVESIVSPHTYVPPGYQPIMPTNFGERLTAQDMADLVLFLESQDQLLPSAEDNPILTTLTGELTADKLIDQQTFDGLAGDVVIIRLTSDDFDPLLSILAENGTEFANNDDFAGTKNARVGPLLLPSDGTYTLQIDSFDHQSTGSYSVEVAAYTACGTAPISIVVTTNQSVNLRSAPSTSGDIAGEVHNDDCFSVIGRASNDNWLQIQTPDGQSGWIATSFVETTGGLDAVRVVSN